MPPSQHDIDFLERAIDRAVSGFEKVMDAKLETIHAELRGINRRLSRVDQVEQEIASLSDRVTAVEAFKSQHEHRLGKIEEGRRDLRAWLWDKAPSILIATAALVYTVLH